MKLLAVVSSYFPKLEELEENIQSYLPWVDKLIIWENTPKEQSKIKELTDKLNCDKIQVRTTGENEFLAKPFNICVQWAKENGYTHILTMDQDSKFENGNFERYIELVKNCTDDKIGCFSPNIGNKRTSSKEIIAIETAITSGAIYPLSVFDNIGLFDEKLLIDCVDTEFCLRAHTHNIKTVCVTSINLLHHLGSFKKTKVGLLLNNYSAQRTYYLLRNRILIEKKYPKYDDNKKSFFKYQLFYRIIKVILEKDSLRKIKAILLALIHASKGKSGRYNI
ncbi:MAG: hypothetical protein LBM07_07740 [Culturomica sp.]|jgi:rhamnosyltransferase|nr:hypothetical protein [Culturomica sp.]